MALCDANGISITQLLTDKDLVEKYRGLETAVKHACPRLFPARARTRAAQARREIVVDTHTDSVHGSVDSSLVRLAGKYIRDEFFNAEDSARNFKQINPQNQPNPRQIGINRQGKGASEWNKSVDNELAAFEDALQTITGDDPAFIDELIDPTFAASETNADKQEQKDKLKFQCNTVLRLLQNLKQDHFGTYVVQSNSPQSCGLTIREMVALGYRSLQDNTQDDRDYAENWKNPAQKEQHMISFIENLYKAMRGYNIDRNGDDEWKTHGAEADNNKCPGGFVNQIAAGLIDHKLVEIKVLTGQTMQGPLLVLLPAVLNELATTNKQLIMNWLSKGIMEPALRDAIIDKLVVTSNMPTAWIGEITEFNREFSPDEIKRFVPQCLNMLQTGELLEKLAAKYPGNFESAPTADALDLKSLQHNFVFDNDNGTISYIEQFCLQELQEVQEPQEPQEPQEQKADNKLLGKKGMAFFKALIGSNLQDLKNLALLNFCASINTDFATAVKSILEQHISTLDPSAKDTLYLTAAKAGYRAVLESCLKSGAAADATFAGDGKKTALHYAAELGCTDIVKLLLEKMSPAAVNAVFNGKTALNKVAFDRDSDNVAFKDEIMLTVFVEDMVAKLAEQTKSTIYQQLKDKLKDRHPNIYSTAMVYCLSRGLVTAKEQELLFIEMVAKGEQDVAELMLKSNPALLLAEGAVTDYSGRKFGYGDTPSITAFQYARLARDSHMLQMMLSVAEKAANNGNAELLEGLKSS